MRASNYNYDAYSENSYAGVHLSSEEHEALMERLGNYSTENTWISGVTNSTLCDTGHNNSPYFYPSERN